jgi:hypothetical protein
MKNKIKNKWKGSKLKYYLVFPLYFIILWGISLINVNFIWLHTFWMISTIGVGTYVIMYGEKIIPNWFKPKLGTVNINKKEIKKELPVIDKVIIDKYENVR